MKSFQVFYSLLINFFNTIIRCNYRKSHLQKCVTELSKNTVALHIQLLFIEISIRCIKIDIDSKTSPRSFLVINLF